MTAELSKSASPGLPAELAETFCYAPFSQMLLQPTGRVSPCCYHFGIDLGDLKRATLAEIWNGKEVKRLREEFLTGNIRKCKSRIHNLGCNRFFDRFKERVQLTAIQDRPPLRLDLRLNGQCNLSCVMCDVWQQPNQVYDDTTFWDEGQEKIFPFLAEVEMLGGEPFIQADTYRLIKAVGLVNQNCVWSFVTNGHYQNHKKILTALAGLKIRQLQVSVDSLRPEVYREIRKGGELAVPLVSIEKFAEFREARAAEGADFRFVFSMCILQQNWQELPRFLDFCREWRALPDLQFAFYDPSKASSLLLCTKEIRQEIYGKAIAAALPGDRVLVATALKPLDSGGMG
jgi:cyclic pyranopterin phosphate synthase